MIMMSSKSREKGVLFKNGFRIADYLEMKHSHINSYSVKSRWSKDLNVKQ